MSMATKTRLRAAAVIVAPLILVPGYLYHPFIANLTDTAAVADAAVADTTRWGLSHILVGLGSGAVVLAFLAIRGYLRDAGEDRWSFLAVPFVVLGGTLYAILPGMEFTLLAATDTGADVQASQAALEPWFMPILLSAASLSAVGFICFAFGVARSEVLSPWTSRIVVSALIVLAASRFFPFGAVQLYIQSAVVLLALWPMGFNMVSEPLEQRAAQPQPASG